jgi:hypothetical protein
MTNFEPTLLLMILRVVKLFQNPMKLSLYVVRVCVVCLCIHTGACQSNQEEVVLCLTVPVSCCSLLCFALALVVLLIHYDSCDLCIPTSIQIKPGSANQNTRTLLYLELFFLVLFESIDSTFAIINWKWAIMRKLWDLPN